MAETPSPKTKCRKCGGAGWVWGRELDEYDEPDPSYGPDDCRYSCDWCEPLPEQPKEPPRPTTVRVRIAVGVDPKGNWQAHGFTDASDDDATSFAIEVWDGEVDDHASGVVVHFVEADIPLPAPQTAEGRVVGGEDE